MWHPYNLSPSIPSNRSSARNIDLYLESLSHEDKVQIKEFPLHTEMWGSDSRRSRSDVGSNTMSQTSFPEDSDRISSEHVPPMQAENIILERRSSDSSQYSHSTLAENDIPDDADLKTPKVVTKEIELSPSLISAEHTEANPSHVENQPVGHLSRQLLSLLSNISAIERQEATVTATAYQELECRVQQLESEKQSWTRRHEALYALRDEDVSNLVKVRWLLAQERREHAAIRKLRDEDLQNVIQLRDKLARATWTASKQAAISAATGPNAAMRRLSDRSSAEGSDLWQVAKTAAMEQRVMELERHNSELRDQLEQAIAKTQVDAQSEGRSRERLIAKMERLKVENEALRREMDRKEDEYMESEHKVEVLQRKLLVYFG